MQPVIDWFEIPVLDLARAQAFYETVLQTTLTRQDYAGPDFEMAVFPSEKEMTGGALVAGHPALQTGMAGTLVYLYAGASIQATLDRVLAAGGQIVMDKTALPPGLGFMAHILDLDGNRVGLHAYA